MWSRPRRLLLFAVAVGAAVAGIVLETLLDPLESAGLAWVALLLGMLTFAGVVGHWLSRTDAELSGPDERFRELEWRASRRSHGLLIVAVATVATALLLPSVDLPVAALLWALLLGSIAVHELSIEYDRRRM